MLDRLVLADRPAEHDAFPGVVARALQRRLGGAERGRGDEDALRVQAVEQGFEALAFIADTVFERDLQPIDEQLVRVHGLARHLLDLVRAHM
jgi:hypothetical protein